MYSTRSSIERQMISIGVKSGFTKSGVSRWLMMGAVSLWFTAGCAVDPAPRGSRYIVSAPFAEFYKNGPAQDFSFPDNKNYGTALPVDSGPDFQLPKGASVTLLKRGMGFSRVVTDNGVAGYVANDRLQPAPAVARAAREEVRTERNMRERVRTVPVRRQPEEQLDFGDLPLPLPS